MINTKNKYILLFLFTFSLFPFTHAQSYLKGVWLTNVGSKALYSKTGIVDAVKTCKASGITDIYCVTWNRGMTMYRSNIMKERFGFAIDSLYGDRDPLRELIDEAHKKNIRVHAWFEFGFSASYRDTGNHILKKYPHWGAIGKDGKIVSKNGFVWMNGFLPEVQQFMKSLLLEVLENYEIDGVQGDDRLPALPGESGYDAYTLGEFKKETGLDASQRGRMDSTWLHWRAGRMNLFMKELYTDIRKQFPKAIISMAPSVYPWSVQEYLQDWPAWLKNGWVDYVIVQVYRKDMDAYKRTLDATLKYAGDKKDKVYSGILTSLGDGYTVDENFLAAMMRYNREAGLKGESYFYFDGLKRSPKFYKKWRRR
jgi:uncharacterized lipoprotein YddW (UPF0748 family)